MTREEAKELLLNISAYDIDMQRGMAKQEAIEMAIKALEQEPCEDATLKDIFCIGCEYKEQQPCEDCISRQAAIDAIENEQKKIMRSDWAIDQAKFSAMSEIRALIADLPSVSTENPNNCDLISREWLKTAIHNFYYGLKHTPTEEDIQAYIDAAPSVSTEKTGRWKRVSIDKYIQHAMAYYKCSECGGQTIGQTEYCPNCGAKMQEVEE